MTPFPQPETRLVFSTDPQSAHRSDFRARKQHTHFTIYTISVAAHLGSIGVEVERVILRDQNVAWRAPLSARPAARRYEQTLSALAAGRKHAEAAMASRLTDHVSSS